MTCPHLSFQHISHPGEAGAIERKQVRNKQEITKAVRANKRPFKGNGSPHPRDHASESASNRALLVVSPGAMRGSFVFHNLQTHRARQNFGNVICMDKRREGAV